MTKPPYHHGNLRNQLIESGIALVTEEGMKNFSLRKVAARCNVSHAAPYSHFKDIDELCFAMGEHVTEKFMEELSSSIENEEDSCRAVTLLGIAYISFFQENPQYFQFIFYHSNTSINIDDEVNDTYPPFVLFKKTAYKMFDAMGIDKEDYLKHLLALWSIVHGIVSLLTNKNVHYSGDWKELLNMNNPKGGCVHETHHT